MKILINIADLHPDSRVCPEHEVDDDCSGGNLKIYLSRRDGKNDELVQDAMYTIWHALPSVDGVEDCDWCEDIDEPLLVVVKDDIDFFAFSKRLEADFEFLKNTKLMTLEFQFENFSYIQSQFRAKMKSYKLNTPHNAAVDAAPASI